MALVREDTLAPLSRTRVVRTSYVPLIAVVGVIVAAVLAVALTDYATGTWSPVRTAMHLMAGYFLAFGTFKLIDLPGFASGFSSYDLIASRLPMYGYIYPCIELFFGLTMLVGAVSTALLSVQLVFMLVSLASVLTHLSSPHRIDCLCLGTVLKVPLTTVTLVETLIMFSLTLYVLVALY